MEVTQPVLSRLITKDVGKISIDTSFLNGIRFFLAIWVAIGHFYMGLGGMQFFHIPHVTNLLLCASVAVDGFMVITGFLMTYHYILREKIEPFHKVSTGLKFYQRRFFRLYPVYFIAIIISYILYNITGVLNADALNHFTNNIKDVISPGHSGYYTQPFSLLSHLTFMHGLISNHVSDILAPAWSLSLEIQFYIIFPILFLLVFANPTLPRLIVVVVVFAIIGYFSPKLFGNYSIPGVFAFYGQPSILIYKLPLFLLGMTMASVGLNKMKWYNLPMVYIIVVLITNKYTNVVVSLIIILMFFENVKFFIPKQAYKILFLCRKILSNKVAVIGADFSYSVYLLHMIILPFSFKIALYLANLYRSKLYITALLAFIIFIISTLVVAFISYNFIEKPFIKIGKKIVTS